MSLRECFLERLTPEYRWLAVDNSLETVLLTHYRTAPLEPMVRLQLLTEDQFARYLRSLARSSEDGDEDAALGLMFIHLDEEIAAVTTRGLVSQIGLRRRRLGGPDWFVERVSASGAERQPKRLWTADPTVGES
jgi:hypothetical protein